MKSLSRGAPRRAALALLLATLLPRPLAAQQPEPGAERRECRCVDAQGRDIERCVCVIGPEVERLGELGARLGRLGDRIGDRFARLPFAGRAVLGVGVWLDQGAELDARGARVGEVERESGADEAGLAEGDVIVALDGRSLLAPLAPDSEEDLDEDQSLPVQRLLALLAEHEPGDRVEVEYLRGGERRTATVELSAPRPFFSDRDVRIETPFARPVPPGVAGAARGLVMRNAFRDCPTRADGPAGWPMLPLANSCAAGAQLVELNEGLAPYFQTESGVLVVDVSAEENPLGLAAGDVIVAVGGREVRGLEHALGMLRSYADDEPVRVRVVRRGQTIELEGTVR